MIGQLKPYDGYKDPGTPWLGKLPDHWAVLPNRALFYEVKERDRPEEQMLSVTITKGVIPQQVLLADSSKKDSSNLDKSAYKLVLPGDIVYNKMRAWQGAVGASKFQGIVSPAYVVQRPREGVLLSRYAHYLLRTPTFSKEAERWSYGITSDMWSLRPEHFKLIYSCRPPLPEQAAIVRFLDHADRRIRDYINAKHKLISLLEEQKQAVIHRAVTRGFDAHVRMKSSAMGLLGELPQHWQAPLLGQCLKAIEQGWSPAAAEGEVVEGQWAVLTLSSVKHGSFDPAATKPIPLSAEVPSAIQVRAGDLLLTRSNTRMLVGDVCVVDSVGQRVIISDLIYRLTVNRKVLVPRFLMYVLLSSFGRSQIERDARGSSGTMPKVAQTHIRSWRVMLPPLDEQVLIVDSIEGESATLVRAIQQAESEIALLREYRARLIADVVTGKLDVREVAERLHVEVDEPDELLADETLEGGDEEELSSEEPAEEVIA